MNNIQYFRSAWGDIKNSPNWFGKLCLLALINFIPVFGQIVTLGYIYGWSREIAWGVHQPMPARIFGNEDGKLYRRGWFILVLTVVVSLLSNIITTIGDTMQQTGIYNASAGGVSVSIGMLASFGVLVSLVGIAFGLFLTILSWIGEMRISIYDRLSAGFQVSKIWKMFRHDTSGIMRIFGMYLLVSLILGLILSFIIGTLVVMAMLAGIASVAASGYNIGSVEPMTDAQAIALFIRIMSGTGFVGILGLLISLLVVSLSGEFISLLLARAMGYWTMQFDVPNWKGQDEPMPFELAAAASIAGAGGVGVAGTPGAAGTPSAAGTAGTPGAVGMPGATGTPDAVGTAGSPGAAGTAGGFVGDTPVNQPYQQSPYGVATAPEPVVEPAPVEPTPVEPVVTTPVPAELIIEPAPVESAIPEPVIPEPVFVEPIIPESTVPEPLIPEPAVEPAPVESIVEPTPAEPVVEPTPAEPVVEPAPAGPVVEDVSPEEPSA